MMTAKEEFLYLARAKSDDCEFEKIEKEVSLYFDLNCNTTSEMCSEKQLAEYEFFRFKNMKTSVFIDFFTEYEKRYNLQALNSAAQKLAVRRIRTGVLISDAEYMERSNAVTEAAKDLILQEKYRVWTETLVKATVGILKYAAGYVDRIDENILKDEGMNRD